MASNKYSIVEYFNENDGYRCGYCKSETSNFSHGMWAYQLTVQDYQELIDRGWRRSGYYCYKPTMHKICCPMYTIRCNMLQFKISKSQKKIIKRMNRFLTSGERCKHQLSDSDGETTHTGMPEGTGSDAHLIEKHQAKHAISKEASVVSTVTPSLQHLIAPTSFPKGASSLENDVRQQESPANPPSHTEVVVDMPEKKLENQTPTQTLKAPKPGQGPDKERPPCKKAKLIRMERKQQRIASRGLANETVPSKSKVDNCPKTLEDFLHGEMPASPAHRLKVRLVRSQPPSTDFKSSVEESFSVYHRYQVKVHGDPEWKCNMSQYKRFLVKSPLELKLVARNSQAFSSTFNQSWRLFAKYQKVIHNETDAECGRSAFLDFLVETPLKAWRPADGSGPPQGYGSFHQQYWLDDKLVAVGVIDILPRCVSSVYFYYDPEFSDLSLGTYGSLREVAFTRTLHLSAPDLQWYYMGFYIHSCPKMRYKASLSPSFLLCPEAYTWQPIEPCRVLLDRKRYSRLEPDAAVSDIDGVVDISKVLVLYDSCAMEYSQYQQVCNKKNQSEDEAVQQYARLVGSKCARRMLLLRQHNA